MEATKHTPGPWEVTGPDKPGRTISAKSGALAKCFFNTPEGERVANTSLIAASPDLLAALESLLPAIDAALNSGCMDVLVEPCTAARAAINKAKGV